MRGEQASAVPGLDMFTMVILRRRMEAIIAEMVNVLHRSGRSGILNTGMDFSCALTDDKFQSVSVELGLPIHTGAIHLISQAVSAKFGKNMRPGDCFVNNSGYHGNSHCADVTFCAPVFYQDELCFYTIARAHFADIGFPSPTTYAPKARDVYEEGLKLPCIRMQRDYRDVPEVVDICKANIRVPEQFYGDYLGALAAVRTGEKRLVQLCDKYGIDLIKCFLDEFQEYAERMTIEAIRKLPAGTVTREMKHDSWLKEYPEGIPVRATLNVDPENARISIDLTHNIDNLPLGINLTESTTLAACQTAVFNVLGSNIPRCTGSLRMVEIKMREGSCIGRPRFPAATSSATTNLVHVLTPLVQACFADLGIEHAIACGSVGMPASCSVLSGVDFRQGGRPFVNQLEIGLFGGPAVYGHDAWLTYGIASSQGAVQQSSIEISELQHPILFESLALRRDSGGAGRWDGAPGATVTFIARRDPVRFLGTAAAHDFPPPGVCGGQDGAATRTWIVNAEGAQSETPVPPDLTLYPGEKYISQGCGGGGVGDPLERDPDLVRWKTREGWISLQKCRESYGVVLDTEPEQYAVDQEKTARLRQQLRMERG